MHRTQLKSETTQMQKNYLYTFIKLILPETRVPGLHFAADSICVALQIFKHFCLKASMQTHDMLIPRQTSMQMAIQGHYFVVNKEQLRYYILQYNNCGPVCELNSTKVVDFGTN